MNRKTLSATLDDEGTLRLAVPFGRDQAGQDVQITVEPSRDLPFHAREDWRSWVTSLAGSWQGDFERPPQGDYEIREPLS